MRDHRARGKGVLHDFEDSYDDEAYTGELKEIEKELQGLRAVQH